MTRVPFTDVSTLLCRYESRDISPVEVARQCLDVIEPTQSSLNAFRYVDADGALAQARASERRWLAGEPCGPLDGVPVAVKDTLHVAGWSTWAGSLVTGREPAETDAPSVQRLRTAGAVFLGKTTTPEFGWKITTDSPATGVTRNPRDETRTPGGSSGGSAAAVAAGMSLVGLGSDGGGSIRIPAAFTGIVGLKASHGRVPVWPATVLQALAHVGPLTQTVADAALLLDVMAGPDPLDWTTGPPPIRYGSCLDEGVDGLRVGVVTDAYDTAVEPDIADAVSAAGRALDANGACVENVDMPFAEPADAFDTLWFLGMAHRIAAVPEPMREFLDEKLRMHAEKASATSTEQLAEAVMTMTELRITVGTFHQSYDLLLTPTMPVTAFSADLAQPPGITSDSWTSWSPFTYPFNLTQQPAISIPFGTSQGLPIGVQVIAAKHRDGLVLRAGQVLETAAAAPNR